MKLNNIWKDCCCKYIVYIKACIQFPFNTCTGICYKEA